GGPGSGRPPGRLGQRQRAGQRHQPGGAPTGGGRCRRGGHERRNTSPGGGLAGSRRLHGREGHAAPEGVRAAGHCISFGGTRRNPRLGASYLQMGGHLNFRRLVVAAVAVALPLATVLPVSAADAVNQKQTIDSGANTLRSPMAQTFKAGLSGQIDRISLEQTFTTLTENVQLQGVSNGKPDGTVLGSSSFTGALGCCRLWKDFTFNPTVAVTAGTSYAIVVTPSSNLTWYDSYSFDAYTDGQMWLMVSGSWAYQTSYGRDFTFQEWLVSGSTNRPPQVTESSTSVTAPEGSTATMTGTYQDPDGD